MNDAPVNSSPSRSARWTAVLGISLLCSALIGAASQQPAKVVVNVTEPEAVLPLPVPPAGAELMHAAPSEALPGAAGVPSLLPGLGHEKKVVWMEVTAYCGCKKCCGPHARGITASGRSITYNGGHFVAADARFFKFGATLHIPGYDNGNSVEVVDRGGAIKGYHLDVFFPTHEQAKAWGRRWLPVVVDE